jgi:hypothetical protein
MIQNTKRIEFFLWNKNVANRLYFLSQINFKPKIYIGHIEGQLIERRHSNGGRDFFFFSKNPTLYRL